MEKDPATFLPAHTQTSARTEAGAAEDVKPAVNNSVAQHSSLIQSVDKRHVVSSNHRLKVVKREPAKDQNLAA